MPRLLVIPALLFALIHPSAWNRNSPKFGKNNALNGTKFIRNSSPLPTVSALSDSARLESPAP
jgi:hypothetical protein